MAMAANKARNWVVTINGTHELPDIDVTLVQYYVFAREIAPSTGQRHLQGYIELTQQVRMSQLKRIISCAEAHLEPRRGSQEQAINYCFKEDSQPFVYGEPKPDGKARSKTASKAKAEYMEAEILEAMELIQGGATKRDLLWKYPVLYYKYKSLILEWIEDIKQQKHEKDLKEWADTVTLTEDQYAMMDMIDSQTDRQIGWVYDQMGGIGKSWFTKYMVAKHPDKVIRFTNAKTADVALAYEGQEIVFFDFSRVVDGRVNYGVVEDLKNGMLFSGKYESKAKYFGKNPKILCLANFRPDWEAYSDDRWQFKDFSRFRTGRFDQVYEEEAQSNAATEPISEQSQEFRFDDDEKRASE